MKTCFKCETQKPLSEFYKHPQMADGFINKCKDCAKEDARRNREDRLDYYRAYDKQRFKEDPRVLARNKRYAASASGRAAANRASAEWDSRNRIKKGASTIVGNAVRDGRLAKPDVCEVCEANPSRLHGHHDDYAYPLTVRWLCSTCHVLWHKEHGPGLNGF